MRIIAPSVKQVQLSDNIQQIGYAASICYASNKQGTVEFLEELWKKGHRSPFRHGTRYFIFSPNSYIYEPLREFIANSPYCASYLTSNGNLFVSTNEQVYREHQEFKYYKDYEVSDIAYFAKAGKYSENEYIQIIKTARISFEIVTQISTSRELNRVSPNNICEQSTRYCNFKHDKFGNQVTFCQPHWIDCLSSWNIDVHQDDEFHYNEVIVEREKDTNSLIAKYPDGNQIDLNKRTFVAKGVYDGIAYVPVTTTWVEICKMAEEAYFDALKNAMKPQDARGLLPLDTATKCFYTYTIGEWIHILNLRYFGKYGTPHPNAYIIAKEIYKRINEITHKLFEI